MAMQALKITFTTPTATRGARVKVSAPQGTKRYGYDHSLNNEQNAQFAAEEFAREMNWPGKLILGGMGSADYVAVFVPDQLGA